jgi:hypothetical protein|tara:strand:- start:195 stop:1763 length:1569 start_codon:yes stop_codon:yes gene_type:complete
MAAIITDQLRILNAKNFVAGVASTSNSYYSFVGLPNPTDYDSDWNTSPPSPVDNFNQTNNHWDTMIAMKKISKSDVRQVIRRSVWTSGITYDMYRHDIRATNPSQPSNAVDLYSANYYVMNSDYRVYACLQNGTSPENPSGRPSLDEPTFTDLEPREAGTSGDGYIWKYLYTISPSDIVKFDATNYMPVPQDWETSSREAAVRDNAATSGQLKIVTITNRGVALGEANKTYTKVPIKGDGAGAEATVVINNDSKVQSVTISRGGSGYTFGTLDLSAGNVPTGTTAPTFDVIIPPQGGHGADIYKELGGYNVLLYSRIENDSQNPDFITGNQIARVGIVESPLAYDSNSILTLDKASAVYALKLTGVGYSEATFNPDTQIRQTIGIGSTAFGRVVSYDSNTGVLKYWQDRYHVGFNTDGTQNASPTYGFDMHRFTADTGSGGSFNILGGSTTLAIQTSFGSESNPGISTVINSRTYYLGQQFIKGVSQPEVSKYSGNTIYVDNRPSITRSSNQKEDIKVILQF